MPDKVYRTAIYCRLSREDGDKVESNSIASQRAICEDYIARHEDLELVCEPFVDDGYSGVSFNRPQFKKLEEAIRKGALDCIVVKDLSRFSRNYIDGGRYIEKIFPQLVVSRVMRKFDLALAEITAKLVKELREKSGAGVMDAKKALVEVDGDIVRM